MSVFDSVISSLTPKDNLPEQITTLSYIVNHINFDYDLFPTVENGKTNM